MVSGLTQQEPSPEWNVPPVDQPPPPAADWSEGKIRWPRLAGQGDSSIMTQGGSSSQEEVGVTQARIRLPHGSQGQRNLTDLSQQLVRAQFPSWGNLSGYLSRTVTGGGGWSSCIREMEQCRDSWGSGRRQALGGAVICRVS